MVLAGHSRSATAGQLSKLCAAIRRAHCVRVSGSSAWRPNTDLQPISRLRGRAWALTKRGRREEGISELRSGLAAVDAGPLKAFRPLFKAMLVEVYCDWRECDAGIAAAA